MFYEPKYRVLGIDPSSTKLGYAICDFDDPVTTNTVVIAGTIKISSRRLLSIPVINAFDDKQARREYLRRELSELIYEYEPNAIAVETPYLDRKGQNINAFASLTRLNEMFRSLVFRHGLHIEYHEVTPSRAKVSVGAGGNTGDKRLVEDAVLNSDKIIISKYIKRRLLDEHGYDAIAVCNYVGFKSRN